MWIDKTDREQTTVKTNTHTHTHTPTKGREKNHENFSPVGAAVQVVAAAGGLNKGAAAVLARRELAAGVAVGA